jgi:hypothetical protein
MQAAKTSSSHCTEDWACFCRYVFAANCRVAAALVSMAYLPAGCVDEPVNPGQGPHVLPGLHLQQGQRQAACTLVGH